MMMTGTPKPRVLITGGSGFIGSACVAAAVQAGLEPHVIDRNVPDASKNAEHIHVADLMDSALVAHTLAEVRPTLLLHLAWMTVHGTYWTSPENLRWVEASLSLVRQFAESGGRRAVLVGTCAEYDWTGSVPCHEFRTATAPTSLYGQCKDQLRRSALACAGDLGVSLAWARLFFPYGPRENSNRLIPSVVRHLVAGRLAETTAGTQIRDLLYVGEVADALLALLASTVTGPVNVASGERVTLRRAIELAADIIGRPDLVRIGARPMSPDDPGFLVADVNRLKHEVGWEPRVSLRDGLMHTVAYWRQQHGGG